VRARAVIVLHELPQHAVQVALVPDQQPVQALSSCCEHKSLRETVRLGRSYGCLDNSSADRPEHFVKWADELSVAVTDQEPEGPALVLEGGYQVTGLLGDPWPDWVGRDTGQQDLAAVEVDEEQDVNAPEHHGVDVEKVAR
jgi:hypothetical protein